jgi:fumarate reductase flavoprotein subunit
MRGRTIALVSSVLILMMACATQHMEFDFSPYARPNDLNDGEYTGVVNEGLDRAKVKVVVVDGRIADVEILNATAFGWRKNAVRNQLPPRFVETQGADIDAISGATGSTHAVKIAVSFALEQSTAD